MGVYCNHNIGGKKMFTQSESKMILNGLKMKIAYYEKSAMEKSFEIEKRGGECSKSAYRSLDYANRKASEYKSLYKKIYDQMSES